MKVKLLHVNLLLYLAIIVLATAYWSELRWAGAALPSYLDGTIPSPLERRLYVEARSLIDGNDWEKARAQEMLEQSLAIDPNGEAGYWLAELARERNHESEAIEQYERYLRIDPTRLEAYLELSALYERRGQPAGALPVLEAGRVYFEENAVKYRPVIDDDVDSRFNTKALESYENYRLAAGVLRREIESVEARVSSSTNLPR
jgi:tetratricopeptide (TPR) repeat protein